MPINASLSPFEEDKTARSKRHTHSTIAGMEDLTAVLVDLHFAIERLKTFVKAIETEVAALEERIDVATDVANIIRSGPEAYPTDGDIRKRQIKIKRRRPHHENQ